MSIVPAPFLFRFTLPVPRVDKIPRSTAPLLKFPAECFIPFPSVMDRDELFATLSAAWNRHGLAIEVTVQGKKKLPFCDPEAMAASDGVQVWIDTRDTQNQHRASRFCHLFSAMPAGGGDQGTDPVFKQLPVPRAREEAPDADPELLLVEADTSRSGYRLALWFPKESLHGFDPVSGSQLGFYIAIQDGELGRQTLTLSDDFPYEADPSLWASLKLIDH